MCGSSQRRVTLTQPVLAVPRGVEWTLCPIPCRLSLPVEGAASAQWCVEDVVGFGLSTSCAQPDP